MPALSGVSLGGGRGSTAGLAAAITGADDAQNDLATVACEVVVTDPTGAETYAWTLTDPRGVSRTALFDDATIADPVFTPDIVGGGGQWVARVTVTRGSASLVLTKVITIGVDGFVELFAFTSDGVTDLSPSAGSLVVGGKTFTVINGANDALSGPSLVDGDLVISPNASTDLVLTVGTRTAPGLVLPLTSLHADLTSLGTRQLLCMIEVESWSPGATGQGVAIGVEQTSAPMGSGASGCGLVAGCRFQATLRAGATWRADGLAAGTDQSTASIASLASLAVLLSGASARVFSSATAAAFDTPAEVLAGTDVGVGGMRFGATSPTLDRLFLCAMNPSGTPAVIISKIAVWVR